MFKIPRSSYIEFRRADGAALEELTSRGHKEHRRLGQRFYDYFKMHQMTNREDCILADKIYNADFYETPKLIASVIDEDS